MADKNKKLNDLKTLLINHDWFFEYSDSQQKWAEGDRNHKEILKLVKELGKEGQDLYQKYKK
jgi:hypothetical protein